MFICKAGGLGSSRIQQGAACFGAREQRSSAHTNSLLTSSTSDCSLRLRAPAGPASTAAAARAAAAASGLLAAARRLAGSAEAAAAAAAVPGAAGGSWGMTAARNWHSCGAVRMRLQDGRAGGWRTTLLAAQVDGWHEEGTAIEQSAFAAAPLCGSLRVLNHSKGASTQPRPT